MESLNSSGHEDFPGVTIVVGGRWHAFDLAASLNQLGWLDRIITNYPRWFVENWDIPREKIISLPGTFVLIKAIYFLGGNALMMRLQYFVHQAFARQASQHLQGSRLIHGWSSWSEPSFRYAKKHKIPVVLERSSAHILEQSKILNLQHKMLGLKWQKTHPKIEAMEVNEYRLASVIAVPSRFVEQTFIDRGYSRKMLARCCFGVDLNLFKPAEDMHHPASNSRVSFTVAYAGSLSVRKGTKDLLDAFVIADLPAARLVIAGNPDQELKKLIFDLPANIILTGHLPQLQLPNFYQQSHCFVMPSIEEGMAMVQLQAMASGLPLICTTNTGGQDLLEMLGDQCLRHSDGIIQYSAGFVVPINSPHLIAKCITSIYDDAALWTMMRENALRAAQKDMSWDSYARRLIPYYQQVASFPSLGERTNG